MSDSSESPPTMSRRNTLVTLTRKFVSLLKNANKGVIDLKYAASVLNVQKRRIYDITNVLEGIGLIHKKGHSSHVQWRGKVESYVKQDYKKFLHYLKHHEIELKKHEEELDKHIKYAKQNLSNLKEDPLNLSYAYVTRDDLLESFGDDRTLLAVKNYEEFKLLDDETLTLNSDSGSVIDVRLVTREGDSHVQDSQFKEEIINYYMEKESAVKYSTPTSPPKRSRKANISPRYKTYRFIDEAELQVEREEYAKIILRDSRQDHSIWSKIHGNPFETDCPLLRLNDPRWDYKFTLDENEGVCEVFDIPWS